MVYHKHMARAKKRNIKKKKVASPGAKHSVPDGFWAQVRAVLLTVFAVLLIVALMGQGGVALEQTLAALTWLIGAAVFTVPFLCAFRAVQIFQAEGNRVPSVVTAATFLFIALAAGIAELMGEGSASRISNVPADGGTIGMLVAKGALALADRSVALIVLGVLAFLTSLFVLKVSPKKVIDVIRGMFERSSENVARKNAEIAERMKEDKKPAEFHLNEGVPLEVAEKPKLRLSLKNAFRIERPPENNAELPLKTNDTPLTMSNNPNWQPPSLDLLEKKQKGADAGDVEGNAAIIRETLQEFKIDVEMTGANIGPKVTQYTLAPPSGVKLSRIAGLENNIALNLAAPSLRIEAPIPGQKAVGIEVPNRRAADVRLFGVMNSPQWQRSHEPLSFAIGKDIAGDAVVGELNKMPHLLIAGQTGSGKSVMINALLTSLLYRNSPSDMRMILVDPKHVEMTPYQDIPHLLTPVITEPEKCISALRWAVDEMERRYTKLAEHKMREIRSYNLAHPEEAMPYIVIVIDELADLMMMAARDVEALIVRIAQKARAVGIHLVLATQRPSVDVITGLIKANIPARIAFTVASQIDSRTILDQVGAEKLLGMGDMLILTSGMAKPKRVQGAWVTEEEVIKITDHLRAQQLPEYDEEILKKPATFDGRGGMVADYTEGGDKEFEDAVRVVVESGKASTSLLQRRLAIGYGKAARIIETMEEKGIVGPANGAKGREVLITSYDDLYGGGSVAPPEPEM